MSFITVKDSEGKEYLLFYESELYDYKEMGVVLDTLRFMGGLAGVVMMISAVGLALMRKYNSIIRIVAGTALLYPCIGLAVDWSITEAFYDYDFTNLDTVLWDLGPAFIHLSAMVLAFAILGEYNLRNYQRKGHEEEEPGNAAR